MVFFQPNDEEASTQPNPTPTSMIAGNQSKQDLRYRKKSTHFPILTNNNWVLFTFVPCISPGEGSTRERLRRAF